MKEFVNFLSYSKNFGNFYIKNISITIILNNGKSFLNKLIKK